LKEKNTKGGGAGDLVRRFASQSTWAAWLEKNHRSSQGLWLRLAKKGSSLPSVSYSEALEVALCYGWIDGQKRGESEQAWLQRFLPRSARSIWSKINRDKANALIACGWMKAAGLEAIEAAKKGGQWDAAYDRPKALGCRKIFKRRWMRVRGLGNSFSLSTARIDTPCCFVFRR
jgi:uncharacterized protein YdeI (YjbR/CyaY-like superfamily)